MQNETKVDVLAVMDRAAGLHWDHEENADAEDMEAARTVVAALIEAARKASETLRHAYQITSHGQLAHDALERCKRLDAALARIGGAA